MVYRKTRKNQTRLNRRSRKTTRSRKNSRRNRKTMCGGN